MNYTNDSSENDHEKNSSSGDEDDDNENSSSLMIEKFFSDNHQEEFDSTSSDDDDDDNDNESDIENQYSSTKSFYRPNRLSTILRQSNQLVELKLNLLHNSSTLNSLHTNIHSSKSPSTINRTRRLYIPSSLLHQYQTEITHWLQASTCLIDEISTSTYHRRCWSQLLLTYFIERHFINLQFHFCTQLSEENLITRHEHACIPEEDAYKLTTILQKGSKFNIDSNIFDHLRRIIVIKSMQETFNDNTNLQQLYVKQLTSLKQSLVHQQSSIYSKVLLFLSSLYSIKSETMQTLFCQHLLHNPMYSYLINS